MLYYKYDSITPLFKFLMSHLKLLEEITNRSLARFLSVYLEPDIQSYEMGGTLRETHLLKVVTSLILNKQLVAKRRGMEKRYLQFLKSEPGKVLTKPDSVSFGCLSFPL